MRLRGGYNIAVTGRPSREVEVLPEPDVLYLPLRSRRFAFTELCVKDGQRVRPGDVIAADPKNFGVPLLAPRAGTIRLHASDGHVVIEGAAASAEQQYDPEADIPHVPKDPGEADRKRRQLLALGAWQFFSDAHTGMLPDPFGTPRAVIVSTLQLEPFQTRGDVQIGKRLVDFTRGLEHIQSLLERRDAPVGRLRRATGTSLHQPIHLVFPRVNSRLGAELRERLRGHAWVNIVHVPLRYPFDNFRLLARYLGLKPNPKEPVWAVQTGGVLAVDRALTRHLPCTVRLVSLGGPGVMDPKHLKAMPGYPISRILDGRLKDGTVRVLNGGGLTAAALPPGQLGLDVECSGLTVLPEHTEREFLGFMRPGFDRVSYSKAFMSCVLPIALRHTTALRGELRPCVSCGYCEEVCPAGIMPHLIHKYLYRDGLEEAEAARVDLCVGCGLCSFVCPSKIELCGQMLDAQQRISRELHAQEEQP